MFWTLRFSVGKDRVSFKVGMGYTCNTTHVHNRGQKEKWSNRQQAAETTTSRVHDWSGSVTCSPIETRIDLRFRFVVVSAVASVNVVGKLQVRSKAHFQPGPNISTNITCWWVAHARADLVEFLRIKCPIKVVHCPSIMRWLLCIINILSTVGLLTII